MNSSSKVVNMKLDNITTILQSTPSSSHSHPHSYHHLPQPYPSPSSTHDHHHHHIITPSILESKDNKIKTLYETYDESVNVLGTTLLMRAVVEDDISILLRLLSSNNYTSTLFASDKKGRTALDWARMCRNYQVREELH